MRLNFKEIRNIVFKIVLLFVFSFPIIFSLNAGSLTDTYWKVTQSFIFTVVFILLLVWPKQRRKIFWLGLTLFIVMTIFYVFGLIGLADISGSTGFGLIVMNLITYLPQIVKFGYIKKPH